MILSIDHVSKRFGTVVALDDVTFALEAGDVMGILGINGAGKSTLIRMVAGLEKPDIGELTVLDRNPAEEPVTVRGLIGYMSERRALYEWMTVEETIRFVASFYPDWNSDRATELQNRFSLPGDRKVGVLSRGQYARLSFLLTLGHRPPLLLLDEPSYGLDPIVRREFLSVLAEVVADDGATVLMASHLIHEVERIATHVAIIHRGRLLLVQPIARILAETKIIETPLDFDFTRLGDRIIRSVEGSTGRTLTVRGSESKLREILRDSAAQTPAIEIRSASLEDIFCDYALALEEDNV